MRHGGNPRHSRDRGRPPHQNCTPKHTYEASFANLGVKKVLVDSETVKKNQKMLVSGVWSIADLEYEHKEEANAVPWVLGSGSPCPGTVGGKEPMSTGVQGYGAIGTDRLKTDLNAEQFAGAGNVAPERLRHGDPQRQPAEVGVGDSTALEVSLVAGAQVKGRADLDRDDLVCLVRGDVNTVLGRQHGQRTTRQRHAADGANRTGGGDGQVFNGLCRGVQHGSLRIRVCEGIPSATRSIARQDFRRAGEAGA